MNRLSPIIVDQSAAVPRCTRDIVPVITVLYILHINNYRNSFGPQYRFSSHFLSNHSSKFGTSECIVM